jgi:hypothetical protein
MTRLQSISVSALLVLALAGCGSEITPQEYTRVASGPAASETRAPSTPPAAKAAGPARGEMMKVLMTDGTAAMSVGIQPGGAPAKAAAPAIARKIIYDAQIDLVVDSVDPVAKKVTRLVQETGGFIAEQNVSGSPGSLRSMHWRIRVPVDSFESLVDSILPLGELERNNRTSQDVTEQYYDIEARIKNKKVEEQTISKLLERTGKLEDVLKVEMELSRVRGEIEQFEGKIRVLENLSSLATLTLNVREREKYAPPPPVAADFPTQVARTWNASLLSLVNLGKSLALWVVSWALWIPLLVIFGLLAWIVLRWLLRVFVRNLPRLIELARTPITQPPAPTPGS